ncbi:MAG: FHA domain-containing protein [Chitinivibrionales bacterium]|nr:FHA domain-containing protein [Chitinivibrionales bacterium]
MVKAVLDLKEKDAILVSYELPEKEVTIGRSRDNSISIADKSISRHHALIAFTDKGFRIKDLNSLNSIYVNEIKIREAVLQDGDIIELGKVTLIFRQRKPAQAPDGGSHQGGLEETATIPENGEVMSEKDAQDSFESFAEEIEGAVDEHLHLKTEIASVETNRPESSETPPSEDLLAELEMLDRNHLFFLLKLRGKIYTGTEDKFERILCNVFAAGGVDVVISFENILEISAQGWQILCNHNRALKKENKVLLVSHCPLSLIENAKDGSFGENISFFDSTDMAMEFLNSRKNEKKPLSEEIEVESENQRLEMEVLKSGNIAQETIDVAKEMHTTVAGIEKEILQIIFENPFFTPGQIRKALRDPIHGNHRCGYFKIHNYLKKMDLDTPAKRYEFYEMQKQRSQK